MDEQLTLAYARLRTAAQRLRTVNTELDAAEREHRVALELVELIEKRSPDSATGDGK